MNGVSVNRRGDRLEREVLHIVTHAGFDATRQCRVPNGNNLWGGKLVIDVFIHPCNRFPNGLGLEVTEQSVGGSGAYKMPHRVLSIVDAWPFPGLIVLGECKYDMKSAYEWAKKQYGRNWGNGSTRGKYLGIMKLPEFCEFIGLSVVPRVERVEQLEMEL